jgi:hypothetical protein
VYNFVNVVVGAGIVGLPWVFVQSGFWTALVEILICCVLTDYSVNMLVATGIEHGKQNYEDLCMLAFGPIGHFTASFVMTIFDYGAMLSYIIIMGDAASFALDELSGWSADDWNQRRTCIIVLTTLLILPSCLQRDISALSKLSFISVCTVVIIIIIVTVKYFTLDSIDLMIRAGSLDENGLDVLDVASPLRGDALSTCGWTNENLNQSMYQAVATHLPREYFSSSDRSVDISVEAPSPTCTCLSPVCECVLYLQYMSVYGVSSMLY